MHCCSKREKNSPFSITFCCNHVTSLQSLTSCCWKQMLPFVAEAFCGDVWQTSNSPSSFGVGWFKSPQPLPNSLMMHLHHLLYPSTFLSDSRQATLSAELLRCCLAGEKTRARQTSPFVTSSVAQEGVGG